MYSSGRHRKAAAAGLPDALPTVPSGPKGEPILIYMSMCTYIHLSICPHIPTYVVAEK